MVIEPFVRMGPPPRILAAEANDCFMVRLRQGANRIQGCGAKFRAQWRAPLGSLLSGSFPTRTYWPIPTQIKQRLCDSDKGRQPSR